MLNIPYHEHLLSPLEWFKVQPIYHDPEVPLDSTPDENVFRLRKCLEEVYAGAIAKSARSKEKQQQQYNKKVKEQGLSVGDRVLLQNKSIRGKSKLADKWESIPYTVVKILNNVFTIQQEATNIKKTVHRNMLTPCMFLPLRLTTPSRKLVQWAPTLESIQLFDPKTPPSMLHSPGKSSAVSFFCQTLVPGSDHSHHLARWNKRVKRAKDIPKMEGAA